MYMTDLQGGRTLHKISWWLGLMIFLFILGAYVYFTVFAS